MKHREFWLQAIALIAVTFFATALLKWGAEIFLAASPEVAAATITAIAGVVIASAAYLFDRRKTREDAHREHRTRVYMKFANFMFGFFFEEKLKGCRQKTEFLVDDQSRTLAMLEFKRDIVFWGSPNVVNTFTRTLQALSTPGEAADLRVTSRHISACLKAMRSDIGLSNANLSDDFFVEWIIQDRNELIKFRAQGAPVQQA